MWIISQTFFEKIKVVIWSTIDVIYLKLDSDSLGSANMCKYYILYLWFFIHNLERGTFAHCNSDIEQRILTEEETRRDSQRISTLWTTERSKFDNR